MHSKFFFKGIIENTYRCLFILPENPLLFSYSLEAVWNFYHYLKEGNHAFYPSEGKEKLLDLMFAGGPRWQKVKKEKLLVKLVDQHPEINLIINCDCEAPFRYDLRFSVPFFSLAFEEMKHATITYIPSSKKADQIFNGFASTLGILPKELDIPVSRDDKIKARDFIKYLGHSEKNILIITDVSEKKEEFIHNYISYTMRERVTFVETNKFRSLEPRLALAVLSISDLFICEDSIYTYFAKLMGIRTYLFPGSSKILPQETSKLFIDRGDFKKDLLLILPVRK